MSLQIKRTGRSEYGQFCEMLIYGSPGSRKTLVGSTALDPFFLNLEGGLMTIADRGIPFVDIQSVDDLKEVLLYLRGEGAQSCETVVIDTVDEMQRIFIADRLKKERRESMQLQDWGYVGEQMQKAIRAYRNLPKNVIFLCHEKSDQDVESGVMMFKPGLQGAIADQIAGHVDLAAHISVTPVRVGEEMTNKVTLRFQAAPRFPHIKDRSGKMPPFYELNLQTDFQDILKIIYKNSAALAESEVMGEIEVEADRVPSPATLGVNGPAVAENNPSKAKGRPRAVEEVEVKQTPFEPPAKNVKVRKIDEEKAKEKAEGEAVEQVKELLGGVVIEEKASTICSDCQVVVSDEDTVDLAMIKFQVPLCREHLKERLEADKKKSRS